MRPAGATAGPGVPAAVLLSGSGAQDRDGDGVGATGVELGLLKVLASALGEAGVASLRCDDRGVGGSTGSYAAADLDTLTADAAAMVAALRGEPGIDRRRLVLAGHSEGAVVALRAAARDRGVAGLALLAGPGRRIDVVLLEQVERTLRRAGLTADEVASSLARHREAFAAIGAGQPLPDSHEAREWTGGEAWLRSHLAHDLAATAARLRPLAVWIAQGERDRQVTLADAHALATALTATGRARVTLARYPTLDHDFAAAAPGDGSVHLEPEREVDRAFAADLAGFVSALAPASGPRAPARTATAAAPAPGRAAAARRGPRTPGAPPAPTRSPPTPAPP